MIYKHNGSIITDMGGKWLTGGGSTPVDPYNPLHLPPNTIRVRTSNGNVPVGNYDTATLVPGTSDVYDVYKSGIYWSGVLSSNNTNSSNVVEVLGANTSDVTGMLAMFNNCTNLTSVPLFDTSNVTSMDSMFSQCNSLTNVALFDTSSVTNMNNMFNCCSSLSTVPLFNTSNVTNMNTMFYACSSLTNIPLFDTSNVTSMSQMFRYCNMVESGALALYQQASTQATPPSIHSLTFNNCGRDTTTGAAELAQIPSDWK